MKKALSILLAVIMMMLASVPVFAEASANSPSVESSTISIVPIQIGGNSYGAVLLNGNNEEGVALYDQEAGDSLLEFVMVSGSDKSKASLPAITQNISRAEQQIQDAEDLGDLSKGLNKKIKKAINAFYSKAKDRIKVSDLVVSDVFDASLVRNKSTLEQVADGQKIRFKVKPNFTKNDFFVLLHNTNETNWEVVENVEWTDDGCLLITVDELSAFAFAVRNMTPDDPDSEKNGKFWLWFFIILAILLCVAAGVYFFLKKRKSSDQTESKDAASDSTEKPENKNVNSTSNKKSHLSRAQRKSAKAAELQKNAPNQSNSQNSGKHGKKNKRKIRRKISKHSKKNNRK